MRLQQKERYVQGLLLESNECSWNIEEVGMTGEEVLSLGVARAVAREGSALRSVDLS